MTDQGTDSDLLMQFIDHLKTDPLAPPPEGLDADSVTFARVLVQSQQRRPSHSARQRMWDAALNQAEPMPREITLMPKIIALPGSEGVTSTRSTRLAQRQHKRRRAFPVTAAASVIFAVLIITLLATMDRSVPAQEPEQVGSGTSVAMNTQAGFIPVVMASEPIQPGTRIEADMLTTVLWPEEMPLPGPVYTDVEEVVGKYCRGQTSDFMPLLGFNMTDDTPTSFDMPARIENDL